LVNGSFAGSASVDGSAVDGEWDNGDKRVVARFTRVGDHGSLGMTDGLSVGGSSADNSSVDRSQVNDSLADDSLASVSVNGASVDGSSPVGSSSVCGSLIDGGGDGEDKVAVARFKKSGALGSLGVLGNFGAAGSLSESMAGGTKRQRIEGLSE
jgi:hypothetical protein